MRKDKLVRFAFLFAFLLGQMVWVFDAEARSASYAELRALSGKSTQWRLRLNVSAKSRCRFSGRSAANPPPKKAGRTLDVESCAKLAQLFDQAVAEIRKNSAEKLRIPVDAQVYELRLKGAPPKRMVLQAPEECEIQEGGTLKCEHVELSASEKLLLELLSL